MANDSTRIETHTFVGHDEMKLKTESAAVMYALGGTLGFAALTVVVPPIGALGLLIGPSMGSMYAQDGKSAWGGILIRTGGILMTIIAFIDDGDYALAPVFFHGGLTLAIGSTIYNIFISSVRSVHKYNNRVREGAGLSVNPWIHPGGKGAGVQFGLVF